MVDALSYGGSESLLFILPKLHIKASTQSTFSTWLNCNNDPPRFGRASRLFHSVSGVATLVSDRTIRRTQHRPSQFLNTLVGILAFVAGSEQRSRRRHNHRHSV